MKKRRPSKLARGSSGAHGRRILTGVSIALGIAAMEEDGALPDTTVEACFGGAQGLTREAETHLHADLDAATVARAEALAATHGTTTEAVIAAAYQRGLGIATERMRAFNGLAAALADAARSIAALGQPRNPEPNPEQPERSDPIGDHMSAKLEANAALVEAMRRYGITEADLAGRKAN